jgi:NAD(P)-dependent dehydrogenase (short-subunit alcohol dehydrogenase family)
MKRQRSGAIVNVTSIYGDRGFPNSALYVASKHAVIGLTGTAALEAAPFGVRVNAIGPGYIDTAMYARVAGSADNQSAATATISQRRAGRPDEVAPAILFLSGRPGRLSDWPDPVSRRWRHGGLGVMTIGRPQIQLCHWSHGDRILFYFDVPSE